MEINISMVPYNIYKLIFIHPFFSLNCLLPLLKLVLCIQKMEDIVFSVFYKSIAFGFLSDFFFLVSVSAAIRYKILYISQLVIKVLFS